MNKILLAGIAAAALSGVPALAADMPMKAPAYRDPGFSWTGCYIGGNVGGAWSRNEWIDVTGVDDSVQKASGIVGGGQIGCDYQFSGPWVIGIQGMFDWSSLKSSGPEPLFPPFTDSTRIPWFGTATARLGYAVAPSTLLYVKGGAAWVRDENANFTAGVPFTAANETRRGWTAGGGFEWKLAPNWSTFFEYNYMGFGTKVETFSTLSIKENVQTILVGINYRFGGR